MYHTDAQIFQRLHSYSEAPQKREQAPQSTSTSTVAPDIRGAMEREKMAVEDGKEKKGDVEPGM